MQITAADAEALCTIARKAGERIMPYFRRAHGVRSKKDASPVTDADIAAHDTILEALAKTFPGVAVISEEDQMPPQLLRHAPFFLVDPLDGTRSFMRGEGEFSVNIGLVEDCLPRYGVLFAPVLDVLYYGGGGGAFRRRGQEESERIHCRKPPESGMVVTRSRSHAAARTQAYLDSLAIGEILPASSAVKFGWVADGSADLYPRFGRTMEWDTAAGHAIVEAAGGRVTLTDGVSPLVYDKPGFENPGFIVRGLS
ncbi:MAG: 3'(2'),5'-bisphosphate nucleotidase CysQ [Alphaproteobacteria bacterium]|nr:3'(2'),5'-bisphosphate nucleotidase CysQ [Alphaproteobacteria bacterium]